MSTESEENELYQRKVGWHAHKFGLASEATDDDVLEHDRETRAKNQGLPEDADWFKVFCAELKAGIKPVILDFFDHGDGLDLYDDPKRALEVALEAHKNFFPSDE